MTTENNPRAGARAVQWNVGETCTLGTNNLGTSGTVMAVGTNVGFVAADSTKREVKGDLNGAEVVTKMTAVVAVDIGRIRNENAIQDTAERLDVSRNGAFVEVV